MPPPRRRYSRRFPNLFNTNLFTTTNKTSNSSIPVSIRKSTNNTNNIGTLRQLLEFTINVANNNLRILNKNAKEQKAKEEDAVLKIQKAVRHMIDKKIGKSILDDKLRELREEKILNQERLKKIDIVQNALKELLIIQKNITDGIINESDGIINRIKDIFGIVDSSSREINTSIGIRSRGRSSRENSSKVIRSIGRSSRENSSKVIRSIGRSSKENSSKVIRSIGRSSRENSSKTYAVIDNSELIMKNLQDILITVSSPKVWGSIINYDKLTNNVNVTLKIPIPFAPPIKYTFVFDNINSIKDLDANNSITNACRAFCSQEIGNLIGELKNSKEDKQTYNIIINIITQYINENINKPGLTPKDKKALEKIRETIESLEKIRGGKLRKVRKTNVIKKITTKVIRNRKL